MAFPWLKVVYGQVVGRQIDKAVPQVMAFPWLKAWPGAWRRWWTFPAVPQVMAFPWLKGHGQGVESDVQEGGGTAGHGFSMAERTQESQNHDGEHV